jgi:ribose 5-phosphate isomerase A
MSPLEPYASLRWPTEIVEYDAKQSLASVTARRVAALLAARPTPAPRVGLGSGTTSFLTLLTLAAARDELPPALAIVATSYEMEWYASSAGFAVVELDDRGVDVAFDGADQVDPDGALVKGRGGAMHRERAVLEAARHELIVVDGTKHVPVLGGCPLPLDLRPEGIVGTVRAIEAACEATVRLRTGTGKDGPVLSESGGVLADLELPAGRTFDADLASRLMAVPGVGDCGYFAPSAKRQIISG